MWFVVPDAPVPRASENDERHWLAMKVIRPKPAGYFRAVFGRPRSRD